MLTTAVPYEDAAEFLSGKPAVTRALFDRLLPELKARAFTIMAVDSADALQAARDAIATIPRGEDWDKVKKHLAASLEPWLGEGAAVRTEMLMRWHAYQAYAVANKRNLDVNTDLFPYRQYQTAKDGRVRASHAALEGVTLPHDSPFWDRHTPPWEYGCRCDVRGVTAEEADEIREADAGKDEQKRRVLEGPLKDQLEQFGRLQRGDNELYDVRTPSERGETGVEWSSKDLTIPLDALKSRYDADVWKRFTDWAEVTEVEGIGSVWAWLNGQKVAKFRSPLLPDPEGGTLWIDDDVFEELRDAAAEKGYRRGPELRLSADALAELEARELADLRPATVEESVLLTSKGEWVKKTGLADRVSHDESKLPGAVMSHRHPRDIAPSPADVTLLLRHRMKAVRVVTSDRIYTITPGTAKLPKGFEEIRKHPDFEAVKREAFATVNRVAEGYGLTTPDQREALGTHLTLVGLARRGVIGYTVETK